MDGSTHPNNNISCISYMSEEREEHHPCCSCLRSLEASTSIFAYGNLKLVYLFSFSSTVDLLNQQRTRIDTFIRLTDLRIQL